MPLPQRDREQVFPITLVKERIPFAIVAAARNQAK